ncbi:MAG: hypothetical protein Q8O66_00005, partial [bacterium]|nr:hypothetical protein [bacterium]
MLKRSLITLFVLAGIISAVFACLPTDSVFASIDVGTISDAYKYAWGDRCGWLNFFTPQGEVNVRDARLSGYVWSENFGWINLSPSGSGVLNNGEGVLSGYAWGENTGWINFLGVIIVSSGKFTGQAHGDITGTINFDCDRCVVKTDWKPKKEKEGGGPPGGGGGGGGSEISILIDGGKKYTKSRTVVLTLVGGSGTVTMAISESSGFENVSQEPYQTT